MSKNVIKTKIWTIKVEIHDDGTETMTRTNDGFTSIELLGLVDFIREEVMLQIKGLLFPTKIKREIVVNNKDDYSN